MLKLRRILIPTTNRGKAGVLIQVVALFLVCYWFNERVVIVHPLLTAALFVLVFWLIPLWVIRAVLVWRGVL